MNSLVKNVFLVMMGVVAAMSLYVLFFGSFSFSGAVVGTPDSAGYNFGNDWQGILWLAGHAVETPIGNYYYKYCFVPNSLTNYGVDEALGGTSVDFNGDTLEDIYQVSSDLSDDSSDTYNFSSSPYKHWSTGWY